MRDHDDGDAVLVELLEHCHDFDAGPAVEIAGRLIGEHYRGLVDNGARDRDALLLTAGKLAGKMVLTIARPTDARTRSALSRLPCPPADAAP